MKRILPWFVLVLSTAALVVLYPSFPERWPIHWNGAGQINGWTEKSPMGAGSPLLIAAGLTVFFEFLVVLGGKLRNTSLPDPWQRRVAEANTSYVRYIATLLNVFFGYLACTLPFGPPPVACVFLLITGTILYPAYDFSRLAREMRASGAMPSGYKGMAYHDPNDPRIWVPKLGGYGWTLNFAHGRSWAIMSLLLGLPLAISLLVVRSASGG